MTAPAPAFVDRVAVEQALTPRAAVDALTCAIRAGLDPADDPPRIGVDLAHGQLLVMPSRTARCAGLKAATVAPANPAAGLPRIQASYLLFDNDTLALRAIIDGTALTTLRTPAVSVAAVGPALTRFRGPVSLVVFGAGPQAVGHVATLADAGVDIGEICHLVRHPARALLPPGVAVLDVTDPAADRRIEAADIVVCATSARRPLFDSALLRPTVVVIAVGSHEPDARELDGRLLDQAQVIVEDPATALREAGDVICAVDEG